MHAYHVREVEAGAELARWEGSARPTPGTATERAERAEAEYASEAEERLRTRRDGYGGGAEGAARGGEELTALNGRLVNDAEAVAEGRIVSLSNEVRTLNDEFDVAAPPRTPSRRSSRSRCPSTRSPTRGARRGGGGGARLLQIEVRTQWGTIAALATVRGRWRSAALAELRSCAPLAAADAEARGGGEGGGGARGGGATGGGGRGGAPGECRRRWTRRASAAGGAAVATASCRRRDRAASVGRRRPRRRS